MAGSRNKLPEASGSRLTEPGPDDFLSGQPVASPTAAQPWLIGYSGGPDSTALLQLLVNRFDASALVAVHVNHQIHSEADQWSGHCATTATDMGVRFEAVVVGPPGTAPPGGIENWARNARRQAFAEVAGRLDASVLLLAHHGDDQLETVLHHLLRGAGLEGLAGMQPVSTRDGLTVLRPLLQMSGQDLRAVVQQYSLPVIHDSSNDDQSLTRNRLRHDVLPAIENACPGFAAGLLSGAAHLGQVSRALPQLLFGAEIPATLSRQALQNAGQDVAPLMLRVWIRAQGARAPDARRLQDMLTQFTRSASAHPSFIHDGLRISAYRDQIRCEPAETGAAGATHSREAVSFVWQGEREIELPDWHGRITFTSGADGVAADLIRGRSIRVTPLQMSAGMHERRDGPTRRLRQLCQERAIAPDQRRRLPMLVIGSDVLFAAGIGVNARWLASTEATERVVIGWQAL